MVESAAPLSKSTAGHRRRRMQAGSSHQVIGPQGRCPGLIARSVWMHGQVHNQLLSPGPGECLPLTLPGPLTNTLHADDCPNDGDHWSTASGHFPLYCNNSLDATHWLGLPRPNVSHLSERWGELSVAIRSPALSTGRRGLSPGLSPRRVRLRQVLAPTRSVVNPETGSGTMAPLALFLHSPVRRACRLRDLADARFPRQVHRG
jgi:hypothetical protein